MRWVGIGYRPALADWIHSRPDVIGCVEITAEHFFDRNEATLTKLRQHYPLFVHGLGLSLGTPGELDQDYLQKFSQVCDLAQPKWISEHIAFTRTAEVDLGHLNPVRCTPDNLSLLVEHAQQVMEQCQQRLILENITSHLQLPGTLAETDFINQLCERSGCGVLLDVTNLYINSRNHRFDAIDWLYAVDPRHIVQLHVVGYSQGTGRLEDRHDQGIQQPIMDLLHSVLDYAPVQAVIIERDSNFPSTAELEAELHQLEAACGVH